MPRTTTQTQARAAARKRQAQKNEERRLRDDAELIQGETFEAARQRRDDALSAATDAEHEMARAVAALFEMGNHAGQVAVLTGQTETEVKRLRKLAAENTDMGAVPAVAGAARTPNRTTDTADKDRTALAAVSAGNV